jgi:hypothetical protein
MAGRQRQAHEHVATNDNATRKPDPVGAAAAFVLDAGGL